MAENNQGKGNREDIRDNNQSEQRRTSNRGFASMDPEQQREIASKGGQAAHQQGVAHEWTSEEAREAGRKGGQASRGGGRNRSKNNNSNINDNNNQANFGNTDNS